MMVVKTVLTTRVYRAARGHVTCSSLFYMSLTLFFPPRSPGGGGVSAKPPSASGLLHNLSDQDHENIAISWARQIKAYNSPKYPTNKNHMSFGATGNRYPINTPG